MQIGILGILGVAFIILKLTSVIAWSWWWVLAPFWGPAVFAAFFFVLAVTLGLVANVLWH